MTAYKWSQTAADNDDADSTIAWPEGMAPSAVNNSARAMMAALARLIDDLAGALTTGGTSTAYTVTSNQVFDTLANLSGMALRIKFNATNGASPTLNVDGLGAKAIQTKSGTAVATGALIANQVYDLVYDNSIPAFILVNGPPATGILNAPASTVMLFRQTSAPAGWTKDTTNYNNHALRIVTGTPSSGGSTGFTSVFASRTIAQANLPNVNFTVTDNRTFKFRLSNAGAGSDTVNAAAAASGVTNTNPDVDVGVGSITAASGGSGTALDFAVQYVDAIFATKD